MSGLDRQRISNFNQFSSEILKKNGAIDAHPLAGVFYDRRRKFSLIAEERAQNGCNLFSISDAPPSDDVLKLLFDANGRFQSLSMFDQLKIAQVGFHVPRVSPSQSVYQDATDIHLSFQVKDCETGKNEQVYHHERDLLSILTGESGGILIFENGGLPQEAAMVVDKKVQLSRSSKDSSARLGIVYLFHPEDVEHGGIDSITAMGNFFEHFTGSVAEKSEHEEIEQALELFSVAESSAKNLGGVRGQLFKARLVAHARMFELTKNPKYLDFSNAFVEYAPHTTTKKDIFHWMFSKTGNQQESEVYIPRLDSALAPLFIGKKDLSDVSTFGKNGEQDTDSFKRAIDDATELIVRELETPMARSLRLSMAPYFPDHEAQMFGYIKNLTKLAAWSSPSSSDPWRRVATTEEVILLLEEFQQTEYAKTHSFRGSVDLRNVEFYQIPKDGYKDIHYYKSAFRTEFVSGRFGRTQLSENNPVQLYTEIIDRLLHQLRSNIARKS